MKRKYINININVVICLSVIVLAFICLAVVAAKNNQSRMPIPHKVTFEGEYSYDGVNWYKYTEESNISAFRGDVTVKGHLGNRINEGGNLTFFCNHIGVSISVNGEVIYVNTPFEMREMGLPLMPSMCGKRWEQVRCPEIDTEDTIEFRLVNYHKNGNKEAYKEVLSNCYVAPMDKDVLKSSLEIYYKSFQVVGYGLMVIAVMLLGGALTSAVLRVGVTDKLLKAGMVALLTGGYLIFDVMMVYLDDGMLVVKTYGRQICMMLGAHFVERMIAEWFKGKSRGVADAVTTLSGIFLALILIISASGKVLIFDTQFFWVLTQMIVCSALLLLCIVQVIRKRMKVAMESVSCILFTIAVLLDVMGVGYNVYNSAICTKVAFCVLFVVYMMHGTKQVVVGYQAALKNKKLQEELENSRIRLMLSQIQPHFLYNSLTCVMDLCDREPAKAKAAIADFADYLRGNLDALVSEKPISFRVELEHIERYLRLEKLRFEEELNIEYDIQVRDFRVPALSIQPIVENSVKHGLGQKTGGGTVMIHTSETETGYVIRVSDDGVGFSGGEYTDNGGNHIGLENIRKRLEMMEASLEIESEKGKGTIVSVRIPRRD